LAGAEDSVHLDYARASGLILLTKNPADFENLHSQNPIHPGIRLIYQDNDLKRDMSPADIVRAIKNLEDANVTFANACHSLNAWQY
jgi:hypothetical protein